MREIHWSYGSGMAGCLYDGGPGFAATKADAIEAALSGFEDLPESELERARENLESESIHVFSADLPESVGADYVEISCHDGPCPEDDDA